MKIKLTFLVWLIPFLAFAQFIDEQEAREIAAAALKGNAVNTMKKAPKAVAQDHYTFAEPQLELHRIVRSTTDNVPCFYIYNQKSCGEGFAIVSNQGQLLARSDRGAMNYDSAPENVKWLLGQYQKILSDAQSQPYPDDDVAEIAEGMPSLYRFSIEPMIGSSWHQHSPFCDLIKSQYIASGAKEPEKGIVAGCSTIAMAQAMFFWKHPEKGQGTKKWTVGEEEYDVNFGTTIDWANIKHSADKSDPEALAKFCYLVAASINAEVEDGGTSATSNGIVKALKNIFDYDKSIKCDYFLFNEPDIFEDLAFRELAQGRPVIISGQRKKDDTWWPFDYVGHQMVVEGYDADTDHFYINMGWGPGGSEEFGPYNGYYALCVINKYHRYVVAQDIITHIKPNAGGSDTPQIVGLRFTPSHAPLQRMPRRIVEYDKSEGSKNYHMEAEIFSNDMDADIVTGLLAKDFVTGKEYIFEGSTHHLKQNYLQDMVFDIDLSQIEFNGYYLLRPIFRQIDADEWFVIYIMGEEDGEEPYQPDYVDVSNAEPLDLGIEIDFTLDIVSIEVGDSAQIAYNLPLSGVPVTFTSSDPSVLSVDSVGRIAALKKGQATITAQCDEYIFNGNRLVKKSEKVFQIESTETTTDIQTIEPDRPIQLQSVHNLQGIYWGTMERFDQFPPGLYIINGKKILKK